VIFGLGAAVAWGFSDVGAAVVGRRLGSLATVVVAQIAGLVAAVAAYLVERPAWDGTSGDLALLAGSGAIAAIAYVALYRALELGPIALVSPIVAAYAVPPVVLAVLLLDEALAGIVLAGVIVTLAGVALSSSDLRRARTEGSSRAGVPLAVLAMLLFGLASFVLGRESQVLGWLPASTIGRLFSVLALLVLALVRRPEVRGGAAALGGAALVGLADISGIALYTIGTERGLIAIVTAASATFVIIPVAAGIAFLGERPAPNQLAGVGLVVGGLLMLGLG
jgi:drug/metabolite transporter (DMT)-like permease